MNIQVDSNGKTEEMLNDMISFRQSPSNKVMPYNIVQET